MAIWMDEEEAFNAVDDWAVANNKHFAWEEIRQVVNLIYKSGHVICSESSLNPTFPQEDYVYE